MSEGGGGVADRAKWLSGAFDKKDNNGEGVASRPRPRNARSPTRVADRAKWLTSGDAFEKKNGGGGGGVSSPPPSGNSGLISDRLKFLEEQKNKKDGEDVGKARALEAKGASGAVADRAKWLATGEAFKKEDTPPKEPAGPKSTITAERLKFLEETKTEEAERASKARAAEVSSESRVADRAQWLATGEAFKKEEDAEKEVATPTSAITADRLKFLEEDKTEAEAERASRARAAEVSSAARVADRAQWLATGEAFKKEDAEKEVATPTSTISADRLKFLEETNEEEVEKARRARAEEAKNTTAHVAERAQWLATGEAFKKEEVERQELVSPTATISADRLKFLEENKREEAEKASRARALEAKAADAQVAERAQWLATGEAFKKEEVERQELVSPTATITADRLKFLEENKREEAEQASRARALEAKGDANVADRAQWLDTGDAFKKDEVARQELVSPTSTITADRLKFLEETRNEEAEKASKARALEAKSADAHVAERAQWLDTGDAFKKEEVARQELVSPTSTITADRLKFLEETNSEEAEKASKARALEAKSADAHVAERAQWLDTGDAFRKEEVARQELMSPTSTITADRLKFLEETNSEEAEKASKARAEEARKDAEAVVSDRTQWLATGEAFKKEEVERQELVSPTATISAERLKFLEDQKKKEDAERASRARAEEAKNAEAHVSDRAQWLTGEAFRKEEQAEETERVPPSNELIAARLKWLEEEGKKQQLTAKTLAGDPGHEKIAEKLRWLEEQAATADDDEFADALEELDTNEEVAAKARWLEDRATKEKERFEV